MLTRNATLAVLLAVTVVVSMGCAATPSSPLQSTTDLENESLPSPIPEFVLPSITPDPRCIPPCFYGIQPGRTTMTGALSLLGATSEQVSPEGTLIWRTTDPPRPWRPDSRPAVNRIWFAEGLVRAIQIVEQQTVTFGDIVAQYGEPFAVGTGRPGSVLSPIDLMLFYPEEGLAFIGSKERLTDSAITEYTPTPDIQIVVNIDASAVAATELTEEIAQDWVVNSSVFSGLYSWRGFGNPVIEP